MEIFVIFHHFLLHGGKPVGGYSPAQSSVFSTMMMTHSRVGDEPGERITPDLQELEGCIGNLGRCDPILPPECSCSLGTDGRRTEDGEEEEGVLTVA